MKKAIYIILIVLVCTASQIRSQDFIRANPADLDDPQSLFINPAVVPFQNMVLNLGMKLYHVGFVSNNSTALKHSYNSNSIPNFLLPGIGIGVTTESFYTPYFHTVGLGFSMSYSVSRAMAFGISANGLNINYHFDDNNIIDLNDPLFKDMNNWNMSFGVGTLIRPLKNFSFGLSANHINRPDLSLTDSGARQPMTFDFGAKYYYDTFGFSLFGHYQENDIILGFLAEANLYDKGILKTGYHDRSFLCEGQLVVHSGVSLIYRLEYPLNDLGHYSYGSHQFGVSWTMRSNTEYKYNLDASVDTVRIIKQRSLIQIDKILVDDMDRLFSYFGSSDFGIPEGKKSTKLMNNMIEDAEMSLMEETYKRYRDKLDKLLAQPERYDKHNTIDIYCHDNATEERAVRIKNYLVHEIGINKDYIKLYRTYTASKIDSAARQAKVDSLEQAINDRFLEDESEYIELKQPWRETIEPEKIYFNISNVLNRKVYKWRIAIKRISGKTVHIIEGFSQIPDMIEWEGFRGDGELMDVGNYYCYFEYKKSRAQKWQPRNPKPKKIVFVNVTRDRVVRFTPSTPANPEEVEIILQ